MKSTREDVVESEAKYPHLMLSGDAREVVLFTKPKKGTVVKSDEYYRSIGHCFDNWLIDSFTPYTNEIILSNEILRSKYPQYEYPCLTISEDKHIIILLKESEAGTIVWKEEGKYLNNSIGDHSNIIWNIDKFTLYTGKVILNND